MIKAIIFPGILRAQALIFMCAGIYFLSAGMILIIGKRKYYPYL
jgi:hypothetical protein